ncbi:hypothetical protein [uncultured Psychroserpens sp.]|uniref:hypothetical protein n=1 Tax=uncultured Psychroserpens sp. TaxID=255436 RepID=UPI002628DB6E|nr:hypothetical protein [uncultured Psychroserpens sp.]
MVKLSKNEIIFIDNYLQQSEVFYADIRMEMVDHVASEIESKLNADPKKDFYTVFKTYMIHNKANLLKNNKQFLKNIERMIFKSLFKQIVKPASLVTVVLAFLLVNLCIQHTSQDTLQDLVLMLPIASIVPFCVLYIISIKVYRLSRFSGIERLAFVYMMFFQLFNLAVIFLKRFVESNTNHLIIVIILSLIITFSINIILLTYSVIQQYRTGYKQVKPL